MSKAFWRLGRTFQFRPCQPKLGEHPGEVVVARQESGADGSNRTRGHRRRGEDAGLSGVLIEGVGEAVEVPVSIPKGGWISFQATVTARPHSSP